MRKKEHFGFERLSKLHKSSLGGRRKNNDFFSLEPLTHVVPREGVEKEEEERTSEGGSGGKEDSRVVTIV